MQETLISLIDVTHLKIPTAHCKEVSRINPVENKKEQVCKTLVEPDNHALQSVTLVLIVNYGKKSQIAIDFAYRMKGTFLDTLILWVPAENIHTF